LLVKDRADAKLVQEGVAFFVVMNDRKMRREVIVKCFIHSPECFW
jgi:hypothetical protein